ncbi:MAG TPA: hypothetical protein VIM16_08535 [Mucilaginibacter sp.]|jgi:hypothetical protein
MNEDRYIEIKIDPDYTVFKFVSEGRYGNLTKIVSFDEIEGRVNVFNLALGTILSDGKIDFVTTTNNGDRNKILATVAGIVNIFIKKYPEKNVYIAGSDNRRTMLYQRAIAYGYDELIQIFNLYGDISIDSPVSEFEPFDKTKSYAGFLIEKKIVNDG